MVASFLADHRAVHSAFVFVCAEKGCFAGNPISKSTSCTNDPDDLHGPLSRSFEADLSNHMQVLRALAMDERTSSNTFLHLTPLAFPTALETESSSVALKVSLGWSKQAESREWHL